MEAMRAYSTAVPSVVPDPLASDPADTPPAGAASPPGSPASPGPAAPPAGPSDSFGAAGFPGSPGASGTAAVATHPPPPPPPTKVFDQVGAALALGRLMTQLYVTVGGRKPPREGSDRGHRVQPQDATIGLGPLDVEGKFQLRVLAVQAALHRISGVAAEAGLTMPNADDLIAAGPTLVGEEGCRSVSQLHQQLIEVLGASAPPMGTAYELGTALASLSEETRRNGEEFKNAVNAGRIDNIRDLLSRLRSMLPDHAAAAVMGALNNWEDWLRAGQFDGRPIDWQQDGPQVAQALTAQGREWFSLLTGQKTALDLLSVDNYIDAAETLLSQYRKLGKRFMVQWWPYLVTALLVVTVIIGLLFLFGHGATKGIGTIVTLLAGFGITAHTATSTLNKTAASVEDSLWQAELDNAVVRAATALPAGAPAMVAAVVHPGQRAKRMASQRAEVARTQAVADRTATATAQAAAPATTRSALTPDAPPPPAPTATAVPPQEGR